VSVSIMVLVSQYRPMGGLINQVVLRVSVSIMVLVFPGDLMNKVVLRVR